MKTLGKRATWQCGRGCSQAAMRRAGQEVLAINRSQDRESPSGENWTLDTRPPPHQRTNTGISSPSTQCSLQQFQEPSNPAGCTGKGRQTGLPEVSVH